MTEAKRVLFANDDVTISVRIGDGDMEQSRNLRPGDFVEWDDLAAYEKISAERWDAQPNSPLSIITQTEAIQLAKAAEQRRADAALDRDAARGGRQREPLPEGAPWLNPAEVNDPEELSGEELEYVEGKATPEVEDDAQ